MATHQQLNLHIQDAHFTFLSRRQRSCFPHQLKDLSALDVDLCIFKSTFLDADLAPPDAARPAPAALDEHHASLCCSQKMKTSRRAAETEDEPCL